MRRIQNEPSREHPIHSRRTFFTAFALDATAKDLPAQLPDPDGKPADMSKPVQVYILLGQSNMVGMGKVDPAEKDGTLEHAVKAEKKYPYLVTTPVTGPSAGTFVTCASWEAAQARCGSSTTNG